MIPPPLPAISALYAGLGAIWLLVLAGRVSKLRGRFKVGIGDGGEPQLARAIRVHANAVEWLVPLILLLLVAELNRAAPLLLHACGIAAIAGRVLHAAGLSRSSGTSFGRFTGTALTWLALLVLAVWDLWAFVRLAFV